MPIVGQLMGTLITASMNGFGLTGEKVPAMSTAIGTAVVNAFLQAAYTGQSVGLGIGTGTSTGIISGGIVIGPLVGDEISKMMKTFGFTGEKNQQLSMAVGMGIANHMLSALITGSSTVVGIGTGVGSIVGVIGPTLGASIQKELNGQGLTGEKIPLFSQAIGFGVANATSKSVVNTQIVGVAVGTVPPAFPPIPSTGTDSGVIK